MLKSYTMSFDGRMLARGFWLYVCRISGPDGTHLYVGRTGDSSSPNAQSPFKRIGQHLDPRPSAKGNAIDRQLNRKAINPHQCMFEMTAIGPIFDEQTTMDAHRPVRDHMAALERELANMLRDRGYSVPGNHPRTGRPVPKVLEQLEQIVNERFSSAKPTLLLALAREPLAHDRPRSNDVTAPADAPSHTRPAGWPC